MQRSQVTSERAFRVWVEAEAVKQALEKGLGKHAGKEEEAYIQISRRQMTESNSHCTRTTVCSFPNLCLRQSLGKH